MKILFDQGTPVPLRRHLENHTIETEFERGWQELENGELLSTAEDAGFELLVTTDQNLKYQQQLAERKIGIVVLKTTSWPRIQRRIETIRLVIDGCKTADYHEIEIP
ncbi:MAG: hypothetical protein JNL64_08725 [Blastocatellia bacterium]|nr:hypothetical protein [Blastocatellia bacterium]